MLLAPLGTRPPNNIALELSIDVKVKAYIGGGLSPVIVGDIHCPKLTIISVNEMHWVNIMIITRSNNDEQASKQFSMQPV